MADRNIIFTAYEYEKSMELNGQATRRSVKPGFRSAAAELGRDPFSLATARARNTSIRHVWQHNQPRFTTNRYNFSVRLPWFYWAKIINIRGNYLHNPVNKRSPRRVRVHYSGRTTVRRRVNAHNPIVSAISPNRYVARIGTTGHRYRQILFELLSIVHTFVFIPFRGCYLRRFTAAAVCRSKNYSALLPPLFLFGAVHSSFHHLIRYTDIAQIPSNTVAKDPRCSALFNLLYAHLGSADNDIIMVNASFSSRHCRTMIKSNASWSCTFKQFWKLSNLSRPMSTKLEPIKMSYTSYESAADGGQKLPIIIMHGLFGSKSNWNSLSKNLHNMTRRKVCISTNLTMVFGQSIIIIARL